MIKYLIKYNNGHLGVLNVDVTKTYNGQPVTVESEIARWPSWKKDSVIGYEVLTDENFLSDRQFRNAWKTKDGNPGKLDINITKARDIHMDRIREMRNLKLDKLDIDLMRAQEQGNTALATEIIAEKERLRDLPSTFDLSGATTTTQLKALWPDNLDKHGIYK